ncbi:MAG: hypothetical protein ACHQ1G_13565, partial [Planctomycetota bacterium]
MRGLGGWTILFLVLTLLPAGALGWLGLHATAALERQVRVAAEAAEVRVAAGVEDRLRDLEKESSEELRAAAEEAARVLEAAMPVDPPFAALRRACDAAGEGAVLRILDGQGRPLDIASALESLPEWGPCSASLDDAARAEFVRGDAPGALALLGDTAAKLVSPALRARAWA